MKRALAAFLGITVLATAGCSDNSPTGPREGIIVYQDDSLRGEARTFDGNVFNLKDVRGPCGGTTSTDGDWNDCISSLRVPAGWTVTVFKDDSYGGESATFFDDVRDLKDVSGPCGGDWGDCISSMQITPP